MITNTARATALALLVTLVPTAAHAQKAGVPAPGPGSPIAFVIEGGVEYGGDKIVDLLFTNGDTQTLRAGQGGTIAAGLQFQPASVPRLSLAGTVGYKFVTNASDNASIGMSRIPIEVTGRWKLDPDWWIGAGLVRHAAVKVEGDGFFPDADFDASTGATLELGWRWAALTYTSIDYTDPAGDTFAGGSFGVSFRWVSKRK